MGDTLLSDLPILIEIAGARAIHIPAQQALIFLHHNRGFLKFLSGRRYACREKQTEDLVLCDGGPDGEHHRRLTLGS